MLVENIFLGTLTDQKAQGTFFWMHLTVYNLDLNLNEPGHQSFSKFEAEKFWNLKKRI